MAPLIEWFPAGAKHYSVPACAWLCLRFDRVSTVERVLLRGGRLHRFHSWNTFNPDGSLVEERPLGPGDHPFDVGHLQGGVILVRVDFDGLPKDPASPEERLAEPPGHRIDCGVITHRNGTEEEIVFLAHDRIAQLRFPDSTVVAGAVVAKLVPPFLPPVDDEPLRLVLREDGIGVSLPYLRRVPTKVLFVRDELLPEELVPGAIVSPAIIPAKFPALIIEATRQRPLGPMPRTDWSYALPLAMKSATRWEAGEPLARTQFLSRIKISSAEARLRVSWSWCVPAPDVIVDLCWQVYTEDRREGVPKCLEIPRNGAPSYQVTDFFTQSPRNSGKSLEVKLIPRVLGFPLSEQEVTKYHPLMTWPAA